MADFKYIDETTIRTSSSGDYVIVKDVQRDLQIAADYGINGIEINDVFNNAALTDLTFLKDYNLVDKVVIVSRNTFDMRPLNHLPRLKELHLGCKVKGELDFSTFEVLSSFSADVFTKKYSSVLCNQALKHIRLGYFKKPDFQNFEALSKLKSITLVSSSICSTKGLDKLKKLEVLCLLRNRAMKVLEFNKTCSLKFISLCSCTQLTSFKGFSNLPQLSTLQLQGCKRIESLKGLSECKALNALALFDGTMVADGDVTILKNLKKSWLQDFKHYNLKKGDLTNLTSELAYL